MNLSVADIVALTGAEPCEGADLARRVTNIAPIDRASASDLSFVSERKIHHAIQVDTGRRRADQREFYAPGTERVAVLRARKPYDAFVTVARKIYGGALRPISVFDTVGVSPGAMVHPTAGLAATP